VLKSVLIYVFKVSFKYLLKLVDLLKEFVLSVKLTSGLQFHEALAEARLYLLQPINSSYITSRAPLETKRKSTR
jgi:hypothetical protein